MLSGPPQSLCNRRAADTANIISTLFIGDLFRQFRTTVVRLPGADKPSSTPVPAVYLWPVPAAIHTRQTRKLRTRGFVKGFAAKHVLGILIDAKSVRARKVVMWGAAWVST